MKEVLKLSLALGLVSAVAAALLHTADSQTREAKRAALLEKQSADLRKVLPDFGNEPLNDRVEIDGVTFYIARQGELGEVVAVAGEASAKGFGGPVRVLVGLNPDGTVRKVVVTGHTETPGLGTQVTDRQARKTIFDLFSSDGEDSTAEQAVAPNPFLDQFDTFRFDGTLDIRLGPELVPISGATISSGAVTDAVAEVAAAFAVNKDRITE